MLWKESLSIDDQQFHQYKQNKLSHLILTHWTQKEKTRTSDVGNPSLGLGHVPNYGVGKIEPVNGIPTPPMILITSTGSPMTIHI